MTPHTYVLKSKGKVRNKAISIKADFFLTDGTVYVLKDIAICFSKWMHQEVGCRNF